MKTVIYILLISLFSISLLTAQQTKINTDLEVGTLPGSLGVNPSGAATYTIPIDLPEGRAGMTPSLSFNYNSQGGNGLLGIGCSLGGLSSISRTGTTLYHDGVVSGIDFSDDDKIMLDGQRLIVINTTPTETEYRTEIESFSKIVGYGTAGSGHQYYKVWTKSGQIIEYGYTEDSRIQALDKNNNQRDDILTWYINSIKDNLENYILFEYNELRGIGFVKKIEYAGNENSGTLPDYNIVFEYDDRNDIIKNYISGSKIELHDILNQVRIYYKDGTIQKKYNLNYNTDGMYSHLESVTVNDVNGKMLNPTVLEWGENNHQKNTEILEYNIPDVDRFFIDFNGDGKTDIIEAHYSVTSENIKAYTDWFYLERKDVGFVRKRMPGNIDKFFSRLLPGDYNGDGLMDLLYATYFHENYETIYVTKVLFSNGAGFDEKILANPIISPSGNLPELVIGDFDGNGKDELLVSYKDKDPGEDNTFIWQIKEEYPYNDVVFWNYISYGNKELETTTLLTGDFNGDGRTDLLRTSSYHNKTFSDCILLEVDIPNSSFNRIYDTEFPTKWHYIFTGDFNGDGITDILTHAYKNPNYSWEIHCFNGKDSWELFDDLSLSDFNPYDGLDQYWHGIKIADFNGDGKSDIAEFEKIANPSIMANYTIYYSNGYEFEKDNPTTGQIECRAGLNFFGGSHPIKHFNFRTGIDFNGDGKADIYQSNGNYNDNIYFFDIYNNYNSMFSITNGFGSKTSISYKPLSNNDVYTKGVSSQYPIIVIQPALHVVYSITSDKELGEDLKTIYHYSGARIHKLGKGFLGFTSTTVKNYQNNIKTTTEFDIFVKNDKYFYPYAKSIKSWPIDMGSILIESTSNYPEVINTVANYDLIFMPIIEKSILHTRDMNGSFINTTKTFINKNDIDKYGNVKKTITLISPDNLHINDEDDKYAFKNTILSLFETPDLTHWLISRPSIIQQTKEYKEDSNNNDVLLKTFGYFNPGATGWPNLAWTQTIPNGNMALYTNIRYKYDNIYGNRIEETIAAPYANPPVEDRITTYDYNSDYNGRFLTRKTNTLNGINYVTEYDYYKDKGLLKSETFNPGHGSNSLTSKYEYDTFGKLNLIRSPDGILSKTSFKWVTNKPRVSFNMKSDFLFYKETYSIHEDVDDVPDNMVDLVYNAYDKFERETTIVSYDQNGNAIYSLKKYDEKSRLEEISDPHFYHDEYNSTNYKYDNLGRVITVDTPSESIKTDYNGRTTTVIASSTSVWKTKTVNAIGLTETISDPVGTISYKYSASGNVKSINALGATTSMLYDDAGNQTSLIDPNAGITTYVYNAYGELLSQTDAKKNNTKMYYDSFGRLAIKTLTNGETGVAETTKYTYQDEPNVGGFGQIKNISGSNKIEYGYTYDELSRLISKTETINGEVFTSNYTFHKLFNKIATFEYPSGFKIRYNYLSNGYIDKIIDDSTDDMLWQPVNNNGRGQLTEYKLGNKLTTKKEFDIFGYPKTIQTSIIPELPVQNLNYHFNAATGNLEWRQDKNNGNILVEKFGYDTDMLSSRLTSWNVFSQPNYCIAYEENGNIYQKDDVTQSRGYYNYGNGAGTHAVTSVKSPNDDYLEEAIQPQTIKYNAFNKISRIDQFVTDNLSKHSYTYAIEYGPDKARKLSVLYIDNKLIKSKLYVGSNYEVESAPDGAVTKLHYIYGGDGLFAIYKWTADEEADTDVKQLYYIHKNYLGSYETITDEEGKVIEKLSFGPWGRKRNPVDWTYTPSPYKSIFNRGYTGHEHMTEFGLINMNGRLYDPWLGRMLSPDPFVQAPTYSQNFNRYSYVLNNPLKYTDPDGQWVHLVIGAVIGGTINWATHGGEFTWDGLKYFGIGAAAGTLAAGVGAGLGAALAGNAAAGGGFVAGFAGTATASSSGFAAGAISGAAAGVTNGLISGTGNGMMSGMSFGDAFIKDGLDQAWRQGLGGAAFGGIMGTLDAISMREHPLTGSPFKKYAYTDGKNTMTRGAAATENITSTKINASVKLPKTNEPYGIEVEAPRGWEIISGKSTFSYGDAAIEVSQTFSGNNSMCVEFPIGTPNGGGYAAHIQSPKNLNFQGKTNIFYQNKRNFSTLFWFLRLF